MSELKKAIELLEKVVEMQKRNYGNGINTHLELMSLAKEIEVELSMLSDSSVPVAENVVAGDGMKKYELKKLLYLVRDLWCQNVDISTMDEFIDEVASQYQHNHSSDWDDTKLEYEMTNGWSERDEYLFQWLKSKFKITRR